MSSVTGKSFVIYESRHRMGRNWCAIATLALIAAMLHQCALAWMTRDVDSNIAILLLDSLWPLVTCLILIRALVVLFDISDRMYNAE